MPSRKNYSQIHINVPDSLKNTFEQCFPHCRSRFIKNALELALKDRSFFEKVFFYDFPESFFT